MPDAQIHGIEYEIRGNANSAVSSLDKLASTLSKLKSASSGGLGLTAIAGELRVFASAAKAVNSIDTENLTKLTGALKTLGKTKISNRFAKSFSQMSQALAPLVSLSTGVQSLTSVINTLGDAKKVEGIANGFSTLKTSLAGLAELDLSNLTEAAEALGQISNATKANVKPQSPTQKDASAWDKLANSILKTNKAVLKFAGKALIQPFQKGFSSVSNFAKSVGTVASSFKRILGYRLIRTLIKEIGQAFSEGTQNMYQWSKAFGGPVGGSAMTFAQNMDDVATSLAYFKNSVGAAVAPLANLLAPAIRVVTDAAVELLNIINQLIALLTGQTGWTRAIRNATEYGDAVGGAGGKAKEALKYLAPFDELNVLPDDKNRGGGGGLADNYGSMFEEMTEFESGITDFANRIKAAINSADWKGLGTLLGEKVNSIVDRIDFAGAGSKVGEYINAWFTTRYWTLETINFQNIGSKIAEALTGENGIGGALRNIDFNVIGRTLVKGLTILPDIIIGGIRELDWSLVGKSIGDFISGPFQEASEWLKGINFTELANSVYNAVSDLIKSIDYTALVNSVATFAGEALGSVAEFVGALVQREIQNIGNIGTLIAEWWNTNIKADTFSETASNLWQAFKDALGNVGDWVETNIIKPFFEALTHTSWDTFKADFKQKLDDLGLEIKGFWKGVLSFLGLGEEEDDGIGVAEPRPTPGKTGGGAAGSNTMNLLNSFIPAMKEVGMKSAPAFAEGFNNQIYKENLHADVRLEPSIKINQTTIDSKFGSSSGATSLKLPMTANLVWWQKDRSKWTTDWDRIDYTANLNNWQRDRTKWTSDWDKIDYTANLNNWQRDRTKWTSDWDRIDYTANLNNWQKDPTKWKGDNWNNINFKANLNDWQKDPDKWKGASWNNIDFNANIVKVIPPSTTQQISVNAKIDKVITPDGKFTLTKAATGGVFSNGHWSPIQQFASGGSAGLGQIFIARERGPELVGSLGGHTAVMNNDQIVASVSAGVARAISAIRFQMSGFEMAFSVPESQGMDEDALYRAFRRALDETDFGPDEITLDGEPVYRNMVRRNRQNTRMTGVNAFA